MNNNFKKLSTVLQMYTLVTGSLSFTALNYECNKSNTLLIDRTCFMYDSLRSNWHKARETCAKYGMHLASVETSKQVEQIITTFKNKTTLDLWTGGNDIGMEGRLVWEENNRPIIEDVWNHTNPNRGDKDCVYINNDLRLVVSNCSDIRSALCMYRIPSRYGYFGANKQYVCHCMGGDCDSFGYCMDTSGFCSAGWFGLGCQFRSLLSRYYGSLGVLDDNNDTTCSSDFQSPLTIKLRAGSYVRGLRIIVLNPADLQGFNIYFKVNDLTVLCEVRRDTKYLLLALDIFCYNGPFVVDDVILSWRGKKTICSVYVHGGQNFALLQSVSASGAVDDSTLLPVDGRRSHFDSCFEGLPKFGDQTWTLTFSFPKIIHEIILYRKHRMDYLTFYRSDVSGYAYMNGFYVQGYTDSGTLMFRYNDTGKNDDKTIVYILTYVSVALKKIVISIDDAGELRHLELCEVEAYGVCGPPYEGLFCSETCSRFSCPYGECIRGSCNLCYFGVNKYRKCNPPFEAHVNEDYWLNKLMYLNIVILLNVVLLQMICILNQRKKIKDYELNIVYSQSDKPASIDETEIRSSYIA